MDTQMHHGDMHQAHVDEPSKQPEHAAVHNLITSHNATHTAVKNGAWFAASTWKGGKIPGANAKVVIPKGITVDYDSVSNTRLFGLRVDGQIDFATDTDTQMIIDTFVVSSHGTLTIGTEDNPVRGNVQTKILIADNGAINKKWDPQQLSRGIVSHGTVEIHGQAKTSHLRVAVDPSAGDKTLTLGEVPVNWQVGDRIILTGTQYVANGTQDEERTITSINGKRITLNKSLSYNHDTPRNDLKAYVANQSRNVVVATENADKLPSNQRGHVMFMHSDNVDVRYAEFNELGRTDKSKLLDDFKTTSGHAPKRILDSKGNPITGARTNIRGRYALHLHRTGVSGDEKPAVLVGNSVVGSPGWGIVQHDSHAVLENNLSYDVFGAGFVSETGNEIGAWRNNISIKNQGRSQNEKGGAYNHDLGFGGHGFWFQGRLVESEGNVAAGNSGSGLFYFHRGVDEIDPLSENLAIEAWAKGQNTINTSDSPIMGFKDNEVLASGNGLIVIKNSQIQHHDGRTLLDGLKAWEVIQGTELQYTAHYTLKDFDLVGTDTPLRKSAEHEGMRIFHNVEDIVFDGMTVDGFSLGVTLNKETRVVKPLKDWGYIFIDTELKNNKKDWVNLDRNVDKFLSRKDIQPGKLDFQLDNAKSDFVATSNDNKVKNAVSIVGTKTDSLGKTALPFGNENLGYPLHQLRSIAKQQGYYTLPNGKHGVIIDEYISDRLTGDTRKYSFVATLENKNWTQGSGARNLGNLDPKTLKQDNRIIPFESFAFNHPEFVDNKIKPAPPSIPKPQVPVETPPVSPPQEPSVEPPTPDSPVGEPPVSPPQEPSIEPPTTPDPPTGESPIIIDGDNTVRVEAELFNINDFKDINAANRGGAGVGARRDLAVDVAKNSGGGYNVGWISKGEYLKYDINVAESGDYRLSANIASKKSANHGLKASIDGQSSTARFGETGGWQKWQSADGDGVLNLTAGQHTLRVDMLSTGFNLDFLELEQVATANETPVVEQPTPPSQPVPDTPAPVPSGEGSAALRIEAELYNINDFKDVNAANRVGAGVGARRDLAVDVAKNSSGGFNVGWISKGEYLTYDVEVAESGDYRLEANVASKKSAKHSFNASIDGQSSTVKFGATGGWQKWQSASGDDVLSLTAGTHTLRVDMLSTGFNLDFLELEQVNTATNASVANSAGVSPLIDIQPVDKLMGTRTLNKISKGKETDVLTGVEGPNTFVLGDTERVFYDDGIALSSGVSEYALVQGLKLVEGDQIRLHGTAEDYVLGELPGGGKPGNGVFYQQDNQTPELIAVVENASPSELAGAFTFVG